MIDEERGTRNKKQPTTLRPHDPTTHSPQPTIREAFAAQSILVKI